MGGERAAGRGIEAELAKHAGIEVHGNSIRIVFMWQKQRCRETLGLPITKANIKHAAQLRAAVLHDIKMGTFDYARHFPNSRRAGNHSSSRDERLHVLLDRYKPLKAVDITEETERRYNLALDICIGMLGRDRLAAALQPEDIQKLRAELIEDRATSTVNHYLATLAGFLSWCEANGYCRPGLASACVRFEMTERDPDPLTKLELEALLTKGCLHPMDKAAVTLAVYTGLRPGELGALAREDIDLSKGQILVRRAITSTGAFKLPKTGKKRTVLLLPPALEACRQLLTIEHGVPPQTITVQLTRHESVQETVTPLISPATQARKKQVNPWFVPTSWNSKWANIQRRAGVRPRRPYQTRHTYACWCLVARGNLAFIANQMGHKDFTMLVQVYAKWMDDESSNELQHIWTGMQNQTHAATKADSSFDA
ncbi:TPA: site-specific integrase [Pseudomonas aeruginosa]|uniref:site-specific integrase n=1 Tax=Pseudomonas aeruginosa TaxID=287 RepID=UPI00214FBEEC|nr:site-specific integrase [Pseudomonas aeruginosa]HEH6432844.1 site-specific integrase [Pseudomonas aeruginosa]HEP7967080.1 site-specific integrase [Pseudomonas aeruginosa]HEP7977209.1 site-specific integrase [Pseudomonas aeruginosa]HEP8013923.1 site-specific integrase [Pseudomonas aeruginosa]